MSIKKAFSSLGIFLLGALSTFAQKESDIWYFGQNAGVSFVGGKPSHLVDGALNTNEGCSSVCNSQGALLFYTDGVSVWNRCHKLMVNGTGLNGNYSTTQSALIVPQPDKPDLYYIFTNDFQGNSKGLCYSIVNISLNGGNGEVISKNNLLLSSSTEKVTAFRNGTSTAIWIVAHEWNSNRFYSYLIDRSGLKAPVISQAGSVHRGGGGVNGSTNSVGYMKISPDGKKLALAMYGSSQVEIFDFSAQSGSLSNALTLRDSVHTGSYGLEFSPDGNLLYASFVGNSLTPSILVQYQLYSGDVKASESLLFKSSYPASIGALQMGPDGKIYAVVKDSRFLSVIDKPNLKGTPCSYILNAVSLGGRQCGMGLPNLPITSIAMNQTTVPLENINFSCKAGAESIQLDWSVSGEHSLDHYSIMSPGVGKIEEISRIYPQAEYLSAKSYSYCDRDMTGAGKMLYYQLIKTDTNGKEVLAGTCSVIKPVKNRLSFTNLVRQGDPLMLHFRGAWDEKCQIKLLDHEGAVKYQYTVSGQESSVEISGSLLTPGMYFIVVDNGTGQDVLRLFVS